MTNAPKVLDVLDREFLELRARLLQAAAQLDRLDRAEGESAADPRMQGIQQAIAVLAGDQSDRAERIQLIFSRTYEKDWKEKLQLENR